MIVLQTAPGFPALRFACNLCGTTWAAKATEYNIEADEFNREGNRPQGFDGTRLGIKTTSRCPICDVIAEHGIQYDGPTDEADAPAGTDYSEADDDMPENPYNVETLQLSFNVEPGTEYTVSDERITRSMAVVGIDAPDGMRSGVWTIDTGDGYLTISGTIQNAGTVLVVLASAVPDPDYDSEPGITDGADVADLHITNTAAFVEYPNAVFLGRDEISSSIDTYTFELNADHFRHFTWEGVELQYKLIKWDLRYQCLDHLAGINFEHRLTENEYKLDGSTLTIYYRPPYDDGAFYLSYWTKVFHADPTPSDGTYD